MEKIKPKEIHQKEDEIDFKMIWFLIIESKRLIVIVTLAFTIANAIFLYFRPPTYFSSANIAIGSYKNESMDCINANDLITGGLERFRCKDKGDSYARVDSGTKLITLLKSTFQRGDSDFTIRYSYQGDYIILIDVNSTNQNTENKLLEIVTFIKNKHQKEIDKIKEKRKTWLVEYSDKYNSELSILNNKIIELEALKNTLIKKLNLLNNRVNSINSPLSEVEKKIDELEIILTEHHLENIEIELSTLTHKKINITKYQIYGTKIQALYLKRKDYQVLTSEDVYRNSFIDGDITTGLYKEKNNQIILRSFFIGLILSLLIVLFRSRNKIL